MEQSESIKTLADAALARQRAELRLKKLLQDPIIKTNAANSDSIVISLPAGKKPGMKRVLLGGSMNPLNKGDQARIKATIQKLYENDDISLAILSHYYEIDRLVYSGDAVEIVKAPWSDNGIKLVKMASIALFTLLRYFLLALARRILRLRIKAKLFSYDALVIASGIDYSDYVGRLPIYYAFFLTTLFGIIMGKPVMCYAQSMGPVENRTLSRMTRFFLNRMKTISVRDESSLAFLRELKVNRPAIYSTADPAFLLELSSGNPGCTLLRYGIRNIDRPLIGVSLSPAPFAAPENGYCTMGLWYRINRAEAERLSAKYIKKMARICDRLVTNYRVTLVFIPNCTARGDDDRECMKKVHAQMIFQDRAINITGDFSLSESMEIIGACDLFLGTRLHAGIIAAVTGVPLVPLVGTDGPRVPGIMRMLGLEDYIHNIMTDGENEIIAAVNEVWNLREPMKIMMRMRIREVRKKALENISVFREFCFRNGGP